ncbi:hypothetical protein GCM10028801_44610 [Nocardioides maradonensis]
MAAATLWALFAAVAALAGPVSHSDGYAAGALWALGFVVLLLCAIGWTVAALSARRAARRAGA